MTSYFQDGDHDVILRQFARQSLAHIESV